LIGDCSHPKMMVLGIAFDLASKSSAKGPYYQVEAPTDFG